MTALPLLSAAMIVRNEEAHLDACLASLAGVCDEIVVVDTGSTDVTPNIARRHGARLFHLPWQSDFSHARNFALEQARGDWILYIDADERVRPPDHARLRAELAQPECAALAVRFHPRSGYTAYPEYRVFRADPRIRFQGAIHETMRPGIHRVMRDDGKRLGTCCLVMDHVGYDGDQSGKFDRNLSLLRIQIAADPNRIYLHWHLGAVLRDMGHDAEARGAFAHGIALSQEAGPALVRGEACLCYIDLARMLDAIGEDALALLREARARFPENLMLLWLEATILLRRGEIDAARPGPAWNCWRASTPMDCWMRYRTTRASSAPATMPPSARPRFAPAGGRTAPPGSRGRRKGPAAAWNIVPSACSRKRAPGAPPSSRDVRGGQAGSQDLTGGPAAACLPARRRTSRR